MTQSREYGGTAQAREATMVHTELSINWLLIRGFGRFLLLTSLNYTRETVSLVLEGIVELKISEYFPLEMFTDASDKMLAFK